jgi:hypothetical protein
MSLDDRLAIAAQSLRRLCVIAAQSLRNLCANHAQSLRKFCAISAQSLRNLCTIATKSPNSMFAIAARLSSYDWQSPLREYLCNCCRVVLQSLRHFISIAAQ